MNNLTSEIDLLEDNLRATKHKISLIEELKESGKKKGLEIKTRIEKDCENIEKKLKNKKLKLENLRTEIQSISQTIGK